MAKPPDDAHEWVSFEDEDEERTWVFDATFLTSNWMCIFGNGCQGVLTGPTPELVQGCCSYGAHLVDKKDARRVDRFTHLIIAAARQAETDSGLDIAKEADRIGASIATGIGGLRSFQDAYYTLLNKGPDRVNPFAIPSIIPNLGAGWVSIELGTRGPLLSECTACAASNMAIGDG